MAAPVDEGIGIRDVVLHSPQQDGHVIRHDPLEARRPDFRDAGGKEDEGERGQNQLHWPRIFRAVGQWGCVLVPGRTDQVVERPGVTGTRERQNPEGEHEYRIEMVGLPEIVGQPEQIGAE